LNIRKDRQLAKVDLKVTIQYAHIRGSIELYDVLESEVRNALQKAKRDNTPIRFEGANAKKVTFEKGIVDFTIKRI
jgi:hypothetical protein